MEILPKEWFDNEKITQDYRVFQTLKVQYFGAIAIHYKITHCWVELPPDKVELIF